MAGTQRQQRVQESLKEIITEILPSLRDPGLGFTTVTGVEISPDLRVAHVYFSIYGSETERQEGIEALRRASGFVRREVARRIQLRYVPELDFRLDNTPERAERIMELLRQVEEEDAARQAATPAAPAAEKGGGRSGDDSPGA